MIEGQGTLQSPDTVAQVLFDKIGYGQYQITNDILIELLRISCNSLNPRNNYLVEFAIYPFLSFVLFFFTVFCDVMSRMYPPPAAKLLQKQKEK